MTLKLTEKRPGMLLRIGIYKRQMKLKFVFICDYSTYQQLYCQEAFVIYFTFSEKLYGNTLQDRRG